MNSLTNVPAEDVTEMLYRRLQNCVETVVTVAKEVTHLVANNATLDGDSALMGE